MPLRSHLVNTPAFMSDVALKVSQIRGLSTAGIMLVNSSYKRIASVPLL